MTDDQNKQNEPVSEGMSNNAKPEETGTEFKSHM